MTTPTDGAWRVDVGRYLARIGLAPGSGSGSGSGEGAPAPTVEWLERLQLAHMCAVAFENLHVEAGIAVSTDLDWSLGKIVERGYGGWCFELNGAFGALLAAIGFDVRYVSAQVWDPELHELGPDLDHLCLIVTVSGEDWLVDVGFGDSAVTPVRLVDGVEQHRAPRRCRTVWSGGRWQYQEWMHWGDWEVQYALDPTPRRLRDFKPRSDALAAGAGSGYFTEKRFATRAVDGEGGRLWLLRDRLKVRAAGDDPPAEQPVPEERWADVLAGEFRMHLPGACG